MAARIIHGPRWLGTQTEDPNVQNGRWERLGHDDGAYKWSRRTRSPQRLSAFSRAPRLLARSKNARNHRWIQHSTRNLETIKKINSPSRSPLTQPHLPKSTKNPPSHIYTYDRSRYVAARMRERNGIGRGAELLRGRGSFRVLLGVWYVGRAGGEARLKSPEWDGVGDGEGWELVNKLLGGFIGCMYIIWFY